MPRGGRCPHPTRKIHCKGQGSIPLVIFPQTYIVRIRGSTRDVVPPMCLDDLCKCFHITYDVCCVCTNKLLHLKTFKCNVSPRHTHTHLLPLFLPQMNTKLMRPHFPFPHLDGWMLASVLSNQTSSTYGRTIDVPPTTQLDGISRTSTNDHIE